MLESFGRPSLNGHKARQAGVVSLRLQQHASRNYVNVANTHVLRVNVLLFFIPIAAGCSAWRSG